VAYDVFISYASKDKLIADAVCARLESSGIRCWIAPRDIVAGTSYGEAIIDAIHGAKVMVLVFSSSANDSGHIPKEVERAVSNGVAILPFRIEDVAPGKSLDYFIGSVHWLDAMTPPMEKHLDDLAATVHKLLPARSGEQGMPAVAGSGVWQHSEPAFAGTAGFKGAVRPAGGIETARASSPKAIWIGVAAVIVVAAIVTGAMLMRHGGSSQTVPEGPGTTNGTPASEATSDSNPVNKPVAPSPSKASTQPSTSPAAAVKSGVDPIVGCYQWFNNVPVTIRADGTMTAGPFVAHWRQVSAARHAYTFTWPLMIESLTISPDQRSISGGNQYGFPISGTRLTGTVGLTGTWQWANGWTVNVSSNGTFTGASFRGTWRAVNAVQRTYEMTWPSPVDSITLLAGGTRISGSNQYGVAISGVKTGPCSGD
jgi:hypothetical protein